MGSPHSPLAALAAAAGLRVAAAGLVSPAQGQPAAAPVRAQVMAAGLEEWNTGEATCRGAATEVSINGAPRNRVTGVSTPEGRVAFQLEATPFEPRHVTIAAPR